MSEENKYTPQFRRFESHQTQKVWANKVVKINRGRILGTSERFSYAEFNREVGNSFSLYARFNPSELREIAAYLTAAADFLEEREAEK